MKILNFMIDKSCHVSWFITIARTQNISIVDTFIQSFDVFYLNIFYLQTSILYPRSIFGILLYCYNLVVSGA